MIDEIASAVDRISDTLGGGDGAIPFRRGLRRHIGDLAWLRTRGLTWDQIARMLTARGVRHKRGQAVSPIQLRTVYALLVKQGTGAVADRNTLVSDHAPARLAVIGPPKSLHGSPGPGNKLAELLKTRVQRLDLDD